MTSSVDREEVENAPKKSQWKWGLVLACIIVLVLLVVVAVFDPMTGPLIRSALESNRNPYFNVLVSNNNATNNTTDVMIVDSNTESNVSTTPNVTSLLDSETIQSNRRMVTSLKEQTTIFYAIGDAPYSLGQAVNLKSQILNIPKDAEFIIHVGDIRSAESKGVCLKEEYTRVSSILKLSRVPVFILLGDNDWNDCPNAEAGLTFWKNEFIEFDQRYWKNNAFQVSRQFKRRENFGFIHKGTLFIGVNIVAQPILNTTEWNQRLTDDYKWTKSMIQKYTRNATKSVGRIVIFAHANPKRTHDTYFKPLGLFIKNTLKNRIPILYLHGDEHKWIYEPSYLGSSSVLRISLVGEAQEAPLRVLAHATGTSASTDVAFTYQRHSYKY